MSQVRNVDFYPANAITSPSNVNGNYTRIQTGVGNIDETNIRVEGIDTRNLIGPAIMLKSVQQSNEYSLTFPAVPAAGAQYPFYSEASPFGGKAINTPEWPINHDATGATNTAVGQGTKLLVNQAVKEGDIVRIRWWLSQFTLASNNGSVAQDHSSQLIFIGARPQGGTNGSGVGEWCAIVYPKINTTSAALLDANFVSPAALANVVLVDPPAAIPGLGGTVEPITGGRFDHCSFIPHFIMTAGNSNASHATAGYLFQELPIQGEFVFRCNANTTLFGVQLFFSGAWRMADAGGGTPGLYLEDEDCDNSVPRFGVNGTFGFERTYVETTIYRNTST